MGFRVAALGSGMQKVQRSASPIIATSFVPVISIQGIATLPNACAGSPRRGLLGLNTMAASIRGSVNETLPRIATFALTAWGIAAPKEWPGMPTRARACCKY